VALELDLHSLSRSLSELSDQRRSLWSDAAGLEFEVRFLRPLGEIVEEFQRLAIEFAQEVDAALAELDDC
jgi:hypothetical protein